MYINPKIKYPVFLALSYVLHLLGFISYQGLMTIIGVYLIYWIFVGERK